MHKPRGGCVPSEKLAKKPETSLGCQLVHASLLRIELLLGYLTPNRSVTQGHSNLQAQTSCMHGCFLPIQAARCTHTIWTCNTPEGYKPSWKHMRILFRQGKAKEPRQWKASTQFQARAAHFLGQAKFPRHPRTLRSVGANGPECMPQAQWPGTACLV